MKLIPETVKEALVKKVISQPNVNLKQFAMLNNVGYSSLTKWMKKYKNRIKHSSLPHHQKLSQEERIQHVFKTATLDETALGAYCRQHGLYVSQLNEWKKEFLNKNDDKKNQILKVELKILRAENEKLKQEVRRKDKALAETAALLILKKKAHAIWGDPEDV